MRALITGAGGFVGRHLLSRLRASGAEVLTAGTKAGAGNHYQYGDITSVEENEALFRSFKPQQVYHLAGVASSADPAVFYRVNTEFAAAMLEAIERSIRTEVVILMLGTAAEYGSADIDEMPLRESRLSYPEGHYGVSKFAQMLLGRAASRRGLRILLPRAFNIVGPDMPEHTALGYFAREIAAIERDERPPVLLVGNLTTYRDFIDVRDVTAVLQQMAASDSCLGRVINICSGEPKLMSDVVDELIAASTCSIRIEVDPARYKRIDVPLSYGAPNLLRELLGCTFSVGWSTLCAEMLNTARAARSAVLPLN
jgi:GDP-4-dehydro-6-deoxy-D-mannose reductase